MFSSESVVKMSNGTFKNINNVNRGEFIMNKMNKPVRVDSITSKELHAVGIQLSNGSNVFYATPDSKFMSHTLNNDGSHSLEKSTIFQIHTKGCMLKNSLKLFSNETNVTLSTYDDSDPTLTKTLYSISTLDNTLSYFVNGVIVFCDSN